MDSNLHLIIASQRAEDAIRAATAERQARAVRLAAKPATPRRRWLVGRATPPTTVPAVPQR